MIRVSPLRFFLVVSPPAAWLRVALAATVVLACATLWFNPADVDSAYGGILLLQMFGMSSGYAAQAARGHFDPLLGGGRSRRGTALAHLAATAMPGMLARTIVASAAWLLGRFSDAASPSRTVALLLVTSVAWAAGLPLPRLTAGALWSLLLVAVAMSRWGVALLPMVEPSPSSFSPVARAALRCAGCPFLLLGRFVGASDWRVLGIDLLIAVVAIALGGTYVTQRDYPLTEPA